MSKLDKVPALIATEKEWSGLTNATHTSQGLMGIASLKTFINVSNLKMPSMNYTHYVRFCRHPQMVLEWLLNCNFLPLYFTGNSTSLDEATNAQFFLENLEDDVEGALERYPISHLDLELYKTLITPDRITPHMILDFRGLGDVALRVGHDEVAKYVQEVCSYVREVQDTLETYGGKWDIEKNHNPMITVLSDYQDGKFLGLGYLDKDVELVHHQHIVDDMNGVGWGYGTACNTYVRVYKKEGDANEQS